MGLRQPDSLHLKRGFMTKFFSVFGPVVMLSISSICGCGPEGDVSAPITLPESAPFQPGRRTMTWSLLNSAFSASRAYALVGADAVTNAYQGDTWTNNA